MGWSGYQGDSRQKAAERLAKAKAGDPEAARLLYIAAHPGGWRPDHRNAAIDAWNEFSPGTAQDLPHMKNPHKGVGGFLGGVMKVAAPFAGLIPGVGPLLGAGLAAGGSALGGALSGDKFSLLDTALAGGAGYMGGKWNPFGSKASAGLQAASGLGNATQSGVGAGQGALSQIGNAGIGALPESAYQAFPGIAGGGTPPWLDPGMSGGPMGGGRGGGGGILDRVLGGGGGGGGWLDKALQYGIPLIGGISSANRQHEADQMMQNAIAGANQEWGARQPLRDFSMQGILGLPSIKAPDLSSAFADPGNPYYRPLRAG
jgi:hypothetical protein